MLTAALFCIGMATRMPALFLNGYYALHGVLAAPFYAALLAWYINRYDAVWSFACAAGAYGAILGAMQPIMAAGAVVPMAFALLAYRLLADSPSNRRAAICAFIFGACAYPSVAGVGILTGSYAPSPSQLPQMALLGLIAILLAGLGTILILPSSDRAVTLKRRLDRDE